MLHSLEMYYNLVIIFSHRNAIQPNLVIFLSMHSTGEEEQTHINWMWLYSGEPQRCECGHWFKLKEVESIVAGAH